MNSKNTWIWIFVAALLAGLIFLSEQFRPAPAPGPAPVLPGFKAGTVTSIQVTPAGQLDIRAERTNAAWQLSKPIPYPAQSASVERLLAALENLTVATRVTGNEMRQRPNGDAEFGFSPPQFTFAIQNRDTLWPVKVGARTAPGDQVYVQIVGVDGVCVVDADWLKLIPRSAESWRDLALVDLRTLAFDRIAISNTAASFELQRTTTNRSWTFARPLAGARVDNDRVRLLLEKLHATRVGRFVTDDAKADLAPFGLQPPELQIVLAQGTNRLVRLEFGKPVGTNTDLIFARRADRGGVVAVPKDFLGAWYEPAEKFRDHRLLTLPRAPDQIEVRGGETFTLQRQSGGLWKVAGRDFPVDSGLVEEFIRSTCALPILQFKDAVTETDLAGYGLAHATRQIIFRTATTNVGGTTNLVLAELSFGGTNAGEIWARRADEQPVYAVPLGDFMKLPDAPWQFRERGLWKFAGADVERLTIRQADRVRELIHLGENSWMLGEGSHGAVTESAIEEASHRFGGMAATLWVEAGAQDLARYGIDTNSTTLQFKLRNGEKREVQIGGMSAAQYPYAAVKLEGQTWVFEMPLALYHMLSGGYLKIPPNAP